MLIEFWFYELEGKLSQNQNSHISKDSATTSGSGSPIPPIPPKRLEIRLGSSSKQKLQTPPASPATSLRSTHGSIK